MKYIFWDHYDATMGGIERMIITLTQELSKTHDIIVIANKNGTIVSELNATNTRCTYLSPEDTHFFSFISTDDLLIDFGIFKDHLNILKSNPYLLLWRVFPRVGYKHRVQKILGKWIFRMLQRNNALLFMDNECHRTMCSELNFDFKKQILPVPFPVGKNRYIPKPNTGVTNITYIGRGGLMRKVKPVKKLVADLNQIETESFCLHIFTDRTDIFESELQALKNTNVDIKYYCGYTCDRLSMKLLDISDIHYSMGISCLEGAALGIPAIIADSSSKDFPAAYRYRWLYEDLENYAGVAVNHEKPLNGHKLDEILRPVKDVNQLKNISNSTYECALYFSSPRIANEIRRLKTQIHIGEVLKFLPFYWLSKPSLDKFIMKN